MTRLQGAIITELESAIPAENSSTGIVPVQSSSAVVEETRATTPPLFEDAWPAEWPSVVPVEWRALMRE